jgi:hypothetical protein
MIERFRTKPNISEYYMLSCSDRKSYYHADEQTARKHFAIRKKDLSSKKEWVLWFIRENDDKTVSREVLDTIKKNPHVPRYVNSEGKDASQVKEERELYASKKLSDLELILKGLAGQAVAQELEKERIPKTRTK